MFCILIELNVLQYFGAYPMGVYWLHMLYTHRVECRGIFWCQIYGFLLGKDIVSSKI